MEIRPWAQYIYTQVCIYQPAKVEVGVVGVG